MSGIYKNKDKNKGFPDLLKSLDGYIWWRRGESNPRPEILYRAFYILSLTNLKSYFQIAGRRAI